MIQKILLNRNAILVLAVIIGLISGEKVSFINKYSLYLLGLAMALSATSLSFREFLPLKQSIKIIAASLFLTYVIPPVIILLLASIFITDPLLFYGFVVIAASPPGAAIIPFTGMLGGDLKYSITGVLGAYIISVIITPLIIGLFTAGETISPSQLIMVMLQVVILPLILSRVLNTHYLKPVVVKWRGKLVDILFAIIIIGAIGSNQGRIFSENNIIFICSVILTAAIFIPGLTFHHITRKSEINIQQRISMNMILTIKSSAFTAATSLALFGPGAALPSAILAVFVLLYLIFLGFLYRNHKHSAL